MIELEARVLEALNKITLVRTDLVVSSFSWLVAITSDSIALILDIDFS